MFLSIFRHPNHPCSYFGLAKQALFKCFGLDSSSESSVSRQRSITAAILLGDFHDSSVAEEASLAVEKVPGYAAITRNMGARRKSSICLIHAAYAADCAVISFWLFSPHALLKGLQLSLTD
ncbi:hypothetical protein SASPL_141184 [Salvia splendens]|uniref:Uncharacterized protein n=1 Tax=Salvia splendens TaxID=180675 RepID=A0A8X8ZCM0_SALSN|nr:hypothetical protein SASPL_141184 [Salvia splendens]